MAEPADAELIRLTRAGDGEAYGTLVARYQGHVYGLAYSLADNWEDAQDIAQETFIRAYANLDQLRDPARFAAWLRRVTFSVSVNWLRTFRPALFRQLEAHVDLDTLQIPDFRPGPAEVVERRELAEAVQRAIASLPPKYRLPLTMFHLDGLSYQRVADFLDIPLGGVKVLIHRARRKLKTLLPAYITEEVAPMVQEVFNEHKLPPEFAVELRRLCLDWLSTGNPEGQKMAVSNRKEQAERIALAAARNPEVALVNKWREEAEPVAKWALAVNGEVPAWGIEICNHAWLQQLQRIVWMIGRETSLPDPAPGRCGSVHVPRRQWAALADQALTRWLGGEGAAPDDPPPGPAIHSLLGKLDDDKAGAARLLRATLRLVLERSPEEFEQGFKEIEADSALARELRDAIRYLEFMCGYRWENIFLDLCRAVGDAAYRAGEMPEFDVGTCAGQASFVYRDDPLRVPTTCAILVGAWAWLQNVSPDVVVSAYPRLAPLAEHTRRQLGEVTPVKRWLAGRLFVGIRVWLGEVDHGDIEQPRPALEPYPTLLSA
ncbi:MAG: sigma-70 family RNA polymerase sigma factor [Armatimonadota bacterium]|nr:MAG: sigma-70 family RNA polymerase sigma factor [Armatimonadota bacterium]